MLFLTSSDGSAAHAGSILDRQTAALVLALLTADSGPVTVAGKMYVFQGRVGETTVGESGDVLASVHKRTQST